jgi:Flp pilus assembly protein TadG
MPMNSISISPIWRRIRRAAADLPGDCRGLAATEFAVIVPIMLVMFFGTVELSSGVAVDRKVTLTARTLSDVTSQAPPSPSINGTYLLNVFNASIWIMYPYDATPTKPQISEVYVGANLKATIVWSQAATISSVNGVPTATLTTSTRSPGNDVTSILPPTLLTANSYLIFSEVSYLYKPTIGYVMAKAGVTLTDVGYTRPRQGTCVIYNNVPASC